jgi:hypothetical protein
LEDQAQIMTSLRLGCMKGLPDYQIANGIGVAGQESKGRQRFTDP